MNWSLAGLIVATVTVICAAEPVQAQCGDPRADRLRELRQGISRVNAFESSQLIQTLEKRRQHERAAKERERARQARRTKRLVPFGLLGAGVLFARLRRNRPN